MLLAAEANHRIANNLTALSGLVLLKARRAKNADAAELLLDISGRIETVGRLHRLLARAKSDRLDVGAYIQEVCEAMKVALAGGKAVAFEYALDDNISAPADLGLPLGMLTAELVTNALKYAHPSGVPLRLRLACSRTGEGEVAFLFEDDGVGFPEGFDPDRDGGLGLQLVRSLAVQMHGRARWTSSALGLGYRMVAPLEATRAAANGNAR